MVIFITLSCSEKNSYFLGQAYPKCSIVYDVFSGIGALQTVHEMGVVYRPWWSLGRHSCVAFGKLFYLFLYFSAVHEDNNGAYLVK